MFEPGVLPEEFSLTRERKTRQPMPQSTEPQVVADEAAEGAQPADSLPAETVEALAQALEEAQAAGEQVDALAEAVANGEAIKTEIIGDEATGRVLVITAEMESAAVAAQPENDPPARKPAPKGRGKKDGDGDYRQLASTPRKTPARCPGFFSLQRGIAIKAYLLPCNALSVLLILPASLLSRCQLNKLTAR